jgi:hypothetical protein
MIRTPPLSIRGPRRMHTIMGTLLGVEMGLRAAAVPDSSGGVQAAIDYMLGNGLC